MPQLKRASRIKKSYPQSKQAAKLKDPGKIQVYVAGDNRTIIEKALEIQGHGTLSGFCGLAAVKEAKRIIAEHDRGVALANNR